MKYCKNGFTMIELVFVMVILGILASVAIPKLTATRDDAKIVKTAQNLITSASEIASYSVANGKTEDDLTIMSNSMGILQQNGDAVLSAKKAIVSAGNIADCLTLEIFSSITDENLTITEGSSAGDIQCETLQSLIDGDKYPLKIRGQSVAY